MGTTKREPKATVAERDLYALAAGWNADRRLSPFESVMWRTEVNPLLRSTGVVMEVLESVPERERVIAAHEWGSRMLAPLRHHVVEDPTGLAPARWVVDQDFDLSYHLRFVRLPDPGSIQQALELAQVLAMAPFDRSRPLWEAVMVDGLADGRAVYLLKLHHSITDGQGTMQMLDMLHGEGSEPRRARALPVPPPERTSGTSLAVQSLLGAPRKLAVGAVKSAAQIGFGIGRMATSPAAAADAVRYAKSLGRMLGGPPAPGSVLLEQRSANRRYGMIELPLSQLSAAGKSCRGTVNDAFLAGLVGGMRRYHEHHGIDIHELTLAFPISLRKSDDPLGSNRFAGARIAAPAGEPDPRRRIQIIGERARSAREEPALGFMDTLSPALSRLPSALVAAMTERVTRSIDIQASNVRGLQRTAYFAGSRIESMFAFGAAPGPAVMVTLISYVGTCGIAFTINAAAVPDHEQLIACFEAGLAEVCALGDQKPPGNHRKPQGEAARGHAGAA
jgi:diacylglycerol O-acyltransferase / wax synthase